MSRTCKDGIERAVRRDIDGKGDWYEETILNPDGSLYDHQAHPLHEHWGHGSDKPKKSS
jgi:hypothetical protein